MTAAPALNHSPSKAAQHFRSALDAAEHGRVMIVNRGKARSAVASTDRLRHYLSPTTPARRRITVDDGAYGVFLEGRPFVSEGQALEAVIAALIESLRDHAEDWVERLRCAPDHAGARSASTTRCFRVQPRPSHAAAEVTAAPPC